MHNHFEKLSTSYNVLRTTDMEPVLYIRDRLQDREHINGADVGCGGGRYDLLLLEHVPGLHLICSDVNEAMVEETARYLKSCGQSNFTAQLVNALDLSLPDNKLDCILTFNAIHHFNAITFLNKTAKALRRTGFVFVYTRLRSQNARNIWGRLFPGFAEKETRLYDLCQVEEWTNKLGLLTLETIKFFRFERSASLVSLLNQAENKHYSTFSLYSPGEFSEALKGFRQQVERHYTNPEKIGWTDENVMIVFRKE